MIGGADNKKQPAYLSFQAINKIMLNTGHPQFDYNGFKAVYDAGEIASKFCKHCKS